jgi:type I restriction enzyme R subunit
MAFEKWPDQYGESNFAVQVTSLVPSAQQMTINFSNNMLNGKVKKPDGYDSSKTRVAVTVGMMTTGYDCQDILNLALMRPVFSPAEFVQIKGRGTRKYLFDYTDYNTNESISFPKKQFKFFDFFATCEYFEHEFEYDEKIKIPKIKKIEKTDSTGKKTDSGDSQGEFVDEDGNKIFKGPIDLATQDEIATISEKQIGEDGMRIDREGFKRAVDEDVLSNETLLNLWNNGDIAAAEDYTKTQIFDKPNHYLNLQGIRKIFNVDRRITIREFLQVAFKQKDGFESKDELLESEWSKFMEVNNVDQAHYAAVKSFFKAYIVDPEVRDIIDTKQLAQLHFCASFDFEEYQKLNSFKTIVPLYIKDYIPLNTFMN